MSAEDERLTPDIVDPGGKLGELLDKEEELEAMLEEARRDAEEVIDRARAAADKSRSSNNHDLEDETAELEREINEERDRLIAELRLHAQKETARLRGLEEGELDELARLVVHRIIGFDEHGESS